MNTLAPWNDGLPAHQVALLGAVIVAIVVILTRIFLLNLMYKTSYGHVGNSHLL